MKLSRFISTSIIACFCVINSANAFDVNSAIRDWAKSKQAQAQIQQNQQNQQNPFQNPNIGYNNPYSRVGIEATQEWQNIYNVLESSTNQLIKNNPVSEPCSISKLKEMDSDVGFFEFNINVNLPKIQDSSATLLSVNTMKQLTENNFNKDEKLEPMSFPSIDSIASFMHYQNNKENNFAQNSSSILLPKQLVDGSKEEFIKQGRTALIDGGDLKRSTMRDIATVGYFIYKNPQLNVNLDKFLLSGVVAFMRNNFMCMYSIQNY